MKIVLAPDSFKGTFTASEVCLALREGVGRAIPDAEVLSLPLADGGEGTLDILLEALGGRTMRCAAVDPLGREIDPEYLLKDSGEAVVEMARSSGLMLLASDECNPWVVGTFGLGLVLRAALDAGATALTLTLGGSATVDGGVGMARALGYRFLDRHGNLLDFEGGRILGKIHRIDKSGADRRLAAVKVRGLCDVTNPLTGPLGAARVFGPQKGADPAMVERLELGLERLAGRFEKDLGKKVARMPGAGAAGGLGAATAAFLGGSLVSGIDYVLDSVNFDKSIEGADLVLTGEGSFDSQSLGGKAISGLLSRSEKRGVPVIVICGRASRHERPKGEVDSLPDAVKGVYSGADLDRSDPSRLLSASEIADLAEMAARRFISPGETGPEAEDAP